MKNKRFTYVLLAVVALIYYKLFVRISSNISEEPNTQLVQVDELKIEHIQSKKKFHLKADYPDPFLKGSGLSSKKNVAPGNENVSLPPPKKEKPIVYWPSIKYYGIIKKSSSKNPRALVSIDGVMYKIYSNDELFDGLIVRSIKQDNISISFQKETRVFPLN